jgi:hypothetical protein
MANSYDVSGVVLTQLGEPPTLEPVTVGETSLLWALRPELVRLDAIPADRPLDGIIGAEPRGAASSELGQRLLAAIVEQTATVALRLLQNTSAVQRMDFLEALRAAVKVLEKSAAQREMLPKRAVPGVTTPAYLAACQALYAGDYRAAKAHLERKWAALAE